jgi:queuosine precursor transporter
VIFRFSIAVAAMVAVVASSNFLVQFPVMVRFGALDLADILTWGAFTYPVAFLVTDLTNRYFGPRGARGVVLVGFGVAVVLSAWLASPRIAMASGTAFLVAQFLDISIFDRLRASPQWWRAPLISSTMGSVFDTAIFFSLAFAAQFVWLGANDLFAIETAPVFGVLDQTAPRWVSWALGDFAVKMAVSLVLLVPYGLMRARIADRVLNPG